MSERSVLAYFKSRDAAQKAAAKLATMHAGYVGVNEFGLHPGVTSYTSAAGGFGTGGDELTSGYNFVLTAYVDETIHGQTLSVIEQSGGYF